MSADDETRDDLPPENDAPGDEPPRDEAGEHELPPPATFAGRQRAEEPAAEEPGSEQPAGDESSEPTDEADEDPREGFTEDFDEIERDLDASLAELDEEGEDPPAAEDGESPEAQAPTPDVPGDLTVEADTVALADKAEAEEAALAGLRARAAAKGPKPEEPVVPAAAQPTAEPAAEPVAAAVSDEPVQEEPSGKPPRAKRLWARFLAASVLIVASVAAATSISLLVYLTDIAAGLGDNDKLASLKDQLADIPAGDPQNILIIGSDRRQGAKGDPGRSDTTILLRVDPDQHAIALLSIPRDLKVNIPGVGVDKFNAAYSAGGADKTLRVVKQLTGLDISHVVNINFNGFADAVDAIDCVYIDVDRRYYIPEEDETAEIDLEAGYQRMCGYNALQYVRFRHFDNDLVRSARQQDFLREARQKLPPGTLIKDRNELLQIFTDYTTSDISEAVPLLELLKTFLAVQSAPVREVHFPAELGETYVTASDDAIKEAVAQFENAEGTPGERPAGESPPNESGGSEAQGGGGSSDNKPDGGGEDKPKPDEPKPDSGGGDQGGEDHFVGPEMQELTADDQARINKLALKKRKNGEQMVQFPIFYPTRLVPGSIVTRDSRAFVIDGPGNDVYHGYKIVVDVPGDSFGHGLYDEYYGVSGTDWVDAPILSNPSETRTIDGRDYLLFYDGDRLRLVGWKTGKGAYWVNNTLLQSLDEGQMLSIATSMRELEQNNEN